MKKRFLALILCLSLPLSGCAAMLERGHETITTHVDYAVTEDASILRAETYQGLVNAMLYFVTGHRAGGAIRLYNYIGDVEGDLANARDEMLYEDPLGAYSLSELSYEVTRVLTYYEVQLQMDYSRTAQEVDELREVTGLAGVRQEFKRLAAGQEASAAFLASHFSGNAQLVELLFHLACLSAPELYRHHSLSGMSIALYPETGTRRIIEVSLPMITPEAVEAEENYARALENAAAVLLEEHPPKGGDYTVEELAAIVRGAGGGFDPNGTAEALAALSGEAAQNLGVLLAMEYLCQQCGVEAEPVVGSELWLIVATPEGYRHLLAKGLFPEAPEAPGDGSGDEEPEPQEPDQLLYTDEELIALGYTWPESLHPACEVYAPQAEEAGTA